MSIKPVTYYEAHCDSCDWTTADFGDDYTAWNDRGSAIENAVNSDWFSRNDGEVLLCPNCQKCEVCGKPGYPNDEHLVCDEHEDYEFDNYCWSLGPRIGDEGCPVCFREAGHRGMHRGHPDSGFDGVEWSGLEWVVAKAVRGEFWRPTKGES